MFLNASHFINQRDVHFLNRFCLRKICAIATVLHKKQLRNETVITELSIQIDTSKCIKQL